MEFAFIYLSYAMPSHICLGYAKLIQAYIQLLKAKLELHTIHPEFRANLDYEEYRALKKVDDPNEGYVDE